MNKIKQEKGVTIIMLAIIVIALMIIAGVAMNLGTFEVDSTVDSKLESELKMVQYAVFQQYSKYKTTYDDKCIVFSEEYNDKVAEFVSQNYGNQALVRTPSENDEKYKRYYLIKPDELIKIGIQDSEYSYIINYYTGEVMNAEKFKTTSGKLLYIKGLNSTENSESF